MFHHLLSRLACLLPVLLVLLSACESYDFKVNDKVVYSPHPLFNDFEVPDEALRACLEQAIADGGISAGTQLSILNCNHAGIEDLDGIASFPGIKVLSLSSNNIRNLVEISTITTLEELYLNDNRIIDPVPLYQLDHLNTIDLSANPGLQCPNKAGFARVETVILPDHCH
jgi:Leucine-rich repeat (LRR) protein